MLKGNRIIVNTAVFRGIITGVILIISIALLSCRSTKIVALETTRSDISRNSDSTYSKNDVSVDTLYIPLDTASIFIPRKWVAINVYSNASEDKDINTVTKRSGRATITLTRLPNGFRTTAQCDSMLYLLITRTREIFTLRKELKSMQDKASTVSDTKTVIFKIPFWAILSLIISVGLNAVFIFFKIKKMLP